MKASNFNATQPPLTKHQRLIWKSDLTQSNSFPTADSFHIFNAYKAESFRSGILLSSFNTLWHPWYQMKGLSKLFPLDAKTSNSIEIDVAKEDRDTKEICKLQEIRPRFLRRRAPQVEFSRIVNHRRGLAIGRPLLL